MSDSRTAKPAVALFNTRFLPYSQTFVYEEIRLHQRYAVEVFCRSRMLAERFPFSPVHVAGHLYGVTCRSAVFEARFRARSFHLVHAHFGTGAVYARGFARRHSLPLVVSFHGHDVTLLASSARWHPAHLRYALLGPGVLRKMTLGLCASDELMELLLAQGVPRERLRVHRLGIDVEAFRPGGKSVTPVRVAMIGRFVAKKGVDIGLRGFARAARRAPDLLRLTVVGDGEMEGSLRRLAAAEGVGDLVEFTGSLSPAKVAALLGASHVLLAPSVVDREGNRESGLIVAKEASAAGAVPIGTRHGGIPEIIDDEITGYLVPERDADAVAERLLLLVRDADLRNRLAIGAREKMLREYDNRERVQALEQLYDEARDRHASSAGR